MVRLTVALSRFGPGTPVVLIMVISTIVGNTTGGSGIHIAGGPAENNIIKDNRHIGPAGRVINQANAKLEDNTGYDS